MCRGCFENPKPVGKIAVNFVRDNESQNSVCRSRNERKDNPEARVPEVATEGELAQTLEGRPTISEEH